MKKHLSKIILIAIILLAIASSIIFASKLTKLPTFEVQMLYTLGTENPVVAVTLQDSKMSVTPEMIEDYLEAYVDSAIVDMSASTVAITHNEDDDTAVRYDLVIFGELNDDGIIDIEDPLLALKEAVAKEKTLEGNDFLAANLDNTDEVIDIADPLRLLKLVVKPTTEVLKEEYVNELTMVHTLGNNEGDVELTLEFNMDVENIPLAFSDAEIVVVDAEDENNKIEYEATLDPDNKNITKLVLTDAVSGTYTVKVIDADEEVYATANFKLDVDNLVNLGSNITISTEDEDNIKALTKNHSRVDVSVGFTGNAEASDFLLTFEVYSDSKRTEEYLIQPTEKLKVPEYNNGTITDAAGNKTLTFKNVDVTKLEDGFVNVIIRYVDESNYKSETIANDITKDSTPINVSTVITEIERETDTKLNLLLEFDTDCANLVNAAGIKALILPYDGKIAPTQPKKADFVDSATLTVMTDNVLTAVVEADEAISVKSRLFLLVDGKIIGIDIPEKNSSELTKLADVTSLALNSKLEATWVATEDASEKGFVGYRVYLLDENNEEIYTTKLGKTATTVKLHEEIKEYELTEVKVKVVALGDGVNNSNSVEVTSTDLTLSAIDLSSATVVFAEDNSKNITLTYAGDKEAVNTTIKDYAGFEIELTNTSDLDPNAEPTKVEVDIADVEITEVTDPDTEEVSTVITIDLSDEMVDYGVWTAALTVKAVDASTSLDSAKTNLTEEYVNAKIKSVEKTSITKDEATLLVTVEGAVNELDVRTSFESTTGGNNEKIVALSNSKSTINLTNIKAGMNVEVIIELILTTADGEEIVLDDAKTNLELISTELFIGEVETIELVTDENDENVTDIKINSTNHKIGKYKNEDVLLALAEILLEGEKAVIDETGISELTLRETDEEKATRTLVLDKSVLADETKVDASMDELILTGTANDLVLVSRDTIDIQGIEQVGTINITGAKALRYSGNAVYPKELSGATTSYSIEEPFSKFTINGVETTKGKVFEFMLNSITKFYTQDGFLVI